MMFKKYRKRPVIIEAIQLTDINLQKCLDFLSSASYLNYSGEITIKTLEGYMKARYGDWIIKGIKGEFYPCKPDIFEKSYEEVKEE